MYTLEDVCVCGGGLIGSYPFYVSVCVPTSPFQLPWGEPFPLMQTSYRVLPHNRSKATRPRATATLVSQWKPFSLRNRLSQLLCHRYRQSKKAGVGTGLEFCKVKNSRDNCVVCWRSFHKTWIRLTPLGYPHKVDLTVNVGLCVSSGRKHGNEITV